MSGQKITGTFSVNKHLVKDNLSLLNGYLTRGAEISSQKQFSSYTGGPVYMPYQGTVVISFENDLNFINKLFINNPFLQSSTGVEVLAVDPNGGTATTNSLQSAVKANNGQIEIFGLGDIKTGGTLTIRTGVGNSIIPQDIITTLISPNPTADGQFGVSVAIDGDTLIIGAVTETLSGRVYIYTRSGGVWTLQDTLESPNPDPFGSVFGDKIAIDGDTVVVGARLEDGDGVSNSGRVYIFTRSGGSWTLQDTLISDNPEIGGAFGDSVAIDGDTVIIGASGEDGDGVSSSGRAYVFTRSGGSWMLQDTLISDNSEINGNFGNSAAIYQDTVIVGAFFENAGGAVNSGRAYIFTRSGGSWTLQDTLVSPTPDASGEFGDSVAIYQDTVIVGASGEDNVSGRAYIYTLGGGTWTLQDTLVSPNQEINGAFGLSVNIYQDTVIVGASNEDTSGIVNSGGSYIFVRSDGAWSLKDTLISPTPTEEALFGVSVAINDIAAVVGEPSFDPGESGRAYIFAL